MNPKESLRFVIRGKRKRSEQHSEGLVWTCHRINTENTRDHISELPDDVLGTLLSSKSLSIRDRVAATSVSSRWTRLYPFPSHLCLDWNTMFSSPPNSSQHKQDPCASRPCTWHCKTDKKRYVEGVSQFLEACKTKAVHHQITIDFCLDEEYANHIDQWVNFASNNGVKTLVLKLSCRQSPIRVEGGYYYTFDCPISSYTFDCPISKSNVERLELKSCKLTVNAISHFTSLTSLLLTGVLLDDNLLHAMSQYCSNLKSLALYHCILPMSRISNKFLDTLAIHFSTIELTEKIKISAPNLTKFEFGGKMNTLSFSEVPNLQSVYLTEDDMWNDQNMRYIFTKLANDLPSGAQVLGLNIRHAPRPSALAGMVTFKVKELNLTFKQWRVRFDMLEVIHILRAFPVLQKFKLQICLPQDIEEPTGGAGAVVDNTHLNHLEEVEIRGFFATRNQIDFAIYFLKFGISLKRLVINPEIQMSEGDGEMNRGSWDEGEREKLCEALQRFFREDREVIIAP